MEKQPVEPQAQAPQQISPLSCLPLLLAIFLFTAGIAWLVGWWRVSSNEQGVYSNMLEIARAAETYREKQGAYPSTFADIMEYSILLSPPRNPYSGQATRFIMPGTDPQPGDISLIPQLAGNSVTDLVIVGYGLRPVPESRRSEWAELPPGPDPQRVLSVVKVSSLPDEVLHPPVQESSEAKQAAERWKLPQGG